MYHFLRGEFLYDIDIQYASPWSTVLLLYTLVSKRAVLTTEIQVFKASECRSFLVIQQTSPWSTVLLLLTLVSERAVLATEMQVLRAPECHPFLVIQHASQWSTGLLSHTLVSKTSLLTTEIQVFRASEWCSFLVELVLRYSLSCRGIIQGLSVSVPRASFPAQKRHKQQ
jgi:hypothetical protein